MFGRAFLTGVVSNISFSMFSIINFKLMMFVSLALNKGEYLVCRIGGDENELEILLLVLSLGSMEVDWNCLAL